MYTTCEYDCRFLLKELYTFPFDMEEGQCSIQNGISPLGTCCASLPVLSKKKSTCASAGIFQSRMIKTSFLPLASSQHGFVKMSSWQINLISSLDEITA